VQVDILPFWDLRPHVLGQGTFAYFEKQLYVRSWTTLMDPLQLQKGCLTGGELPASEARTG